MRLLKSVREVETRVVPAGDPSSTALGSKIGRFFVLEKLGQGGMGVVYAGYDDRLDRRVALKVLHEGMREGEEGGQRLWREAQAMARLSHPNVVSVHEVVRAQGRVFVVMEFVRGQTLTRWLDSEPSWREVLEAFVAAGEGLGAAHELGMVHRDFKPSNVMRSEEGAVKVLDFGLARAVDGGSSKGGGGVSTRTGVGQGSAGALSSSMTVTVAGTVMGTLPYMSPEQQEGVELDARSDQYSFCVAAWACLTARQPFGGGSPKAVLRAKLEGPPRWPKEAPAVPGRVVDALRRGLAVDPEDRWGSMQGLLAELRWDPRQRRRRWSLGLAGAALASAGGLAGRSWVVQRDARCSGAAQKLVGIWDARRKAEAKAAMLGVEREYATQAWAHAESTLDAYAGEWADMHTAACEAGAKGGDGSLLDARMRCLHRSRMGLEATVDTLVDADAQVVEKSYEVVEGLRPLQWCADEEALAAVEEPPLPREVAAVARARKALSRASSDRAAGRIDAARKALQESQAALVNVDYGPVLVEHAVESGKVYEEAGEYRAAEASYGEGLELALENGSERELFRAAGALLAVLSNQQRKVAEGMRYWPLVEAMSRGSEARTLVASHRMAVVLLLQGRAAEAEDKFREVIRLQERASSDAHPSFVRSALGMALLHLGRYREAEPELRAALRGLEATRGLEHPLAASMATSLVWAINAQGRYDESEVECRKALDIAERSLGPEHPFTVDLQATLGTVLMSLERFEDAESQLRAAWSSVARAYGPEHLKMAMVRSNLGSVLVQVGRYEEAKVEYLEGLRIFEKVLGPRHPDVAGRWMNLGLLAKHQGEYAEAETYVLTSLRVRKETLEADHPEIAASQFELASVKKQQGLLKEARPWAEKAWERYRQGDVGPDLHADAALMLGQILWSVTGPYRDRKRAYELVQDAVRLYQEVGVNRARKLSFARAWLKQRRTP